MQRLLSRQHHEHKLIDRVPIEHAVISRLAGGDGDFHRRYPPVREARNMEIPFTWCS